MTRARATLALMLGWGVVFGRLLLQPDLVPYTRDLSRLYVPIRHYLHETLKHGRLPEWFPYESLGVPFIGQIVTATFHPQTWLFLPFSPLTALKLSILVAYLWGATGAYRFARALPASRWAALTSAAALMLSGYAFGMHNNPPYLWSFMTLPWVGWGALRVASKARPRDAAALGIVWALVFLGGDAQGFGLAGVLVLVILVATNLTPRPPSRDGKAGSRWLCAGLATLLALGLASVELLPALAVFAGSFRLTVDAGEAPGAIWAMHPLRLVELIVPGIVPREHLGFVASKLFGGPYEALWSSSLFAGSVAMGLALLGLSRRDRRSWAFLLVAVGALWLACGNRGGLWPLAARVFPVLRRFAYPEKYASLFFVALGPLIAMGCDRLREEPRRSVRLFALLAIAGSIGAAALSLSDPSAPAPLAAVHRSWICGALWSAGFCAVALLAVKLSALRQALPPALALLVFAELWRAHAGYLPLVTRSVFESPNPIAQAIQAHAVGDPLPRVVPFEASPPQDGEPPEAAVRRQVLAMEPEISALYDVGALGIAMLPALPDRLLPIASGQTPWTHWLHGCFRIQPTNDPLKPGATRLALADSLSLVTEACLPYAFLAGAVSASSREEAWRRANTGLPPRSIIWEGGPVLEGSSEQPAVLEYAPGHVRIDVTTSHPAALVIPETRTTGWSATLDGRPTEIYAVNTVAQGIAVSPGHHVAEFRYRTPHLALGAALSLLSLLASLACLMWRPRSMRPAAGAVAQ